MAASARRLPRFATSSSSGAEAPGRLAAVMLLTAAAGRLVFSCRLLLGADPQETVLRVETVFRVEADLVFRVEADLVFRVEADPAKSSGGWRGAGARSAPRRVRRPRRSEGSPW